MCACGNVFWMETPLLKVDFYDFIRNITLAYILFFLIFKKNVFICLIVCFYAFLWFEIYTFWFNIFCCSLRFLNILCFFSFVS